MFDFTSKGIELPLGVHLSGEVATTCPKCSPFRKKKESPCLSVNVDKGAWNCWHCGWKGRFDAVSAFDLPEALPSFEVDFLLDLTGIEYLKRRGISGQTGVANRICNMGNTIVYPRVYPNGQIVGVQYRDTSKTKAEAFSQASGGQLCFWGYHNVFDSGYVCAETVYITEGVEDALSLWEAGIFFTLSLPSGANSLKAVDDPAFQQLLSEAKTFVLVMDSDTVGQKAQEDLARRIGYSKCMKATLPSDCKDANEVLVKYGKDALREAVFGAVPYPVTGLYTVRNSYDKLRGLHRNGMDKGRTTGLESVDEIFRNRDSMVVTIGATPKSGKSRLINYLRIMDAKLHKRKTAFFAPESMPIEYHSSKLISAYMEKPFESLTDDEFQEGYEFVEEYFTWIVPESSDIDSLLELSKVVMESKGVSCYVYDPFNYIQTTSGNEHDDIGKILSKQVEFSRRYNAMLINIAHPKKIEKIKQGKEPNPMAGEYPIVTAYDLSGSAHFANRTDVFLSLWRSQTANKPIRLLCELSKFEEVATMGKQALLAYDVPTSRFRSFYGLEDEVIPANFTSGSEFNLE